MLRKNSAIVCQYSISVSNYFSLDMNTRMAWGDFFEQKIKKQIKIINVEIWELLKSLFSEVNFLLKCLSCSRFLSTVQLIKTGPKKGPFRAETGRRQLCLNSSVKAAVLVAPSEGADPEHSVRQSLSQSYSSEKPYSWQVHFVWPMCDAL